MAATATALSTTPSKPPSSHKNFQKQNTTPFTFSCKNKTLFPLSPIYSRRRHFTTISCSSEEKPFISRFYSTERRRDSDILVEALEREGVTTVFAYPGGASMEIHQALTRSKIIRNVLPRHEQGGVFAAEGYAHSSGLPGVCIATSSPGATNLVTGLADAFMDSIPHIAITGQVPQKVFY